MSNARVSTAQVITYEPEQIPSEDLIIRETWNYAPPSPRLNFYARGYHAGNLGDRQPLPDGKGLPIDTGEMLNASFGITNFPTFMTVNNGSALALANSAYTRQYAQQSADWGYQKPRWHQQRLRSGAGRHAVRKRAKQARNREP